jgi:hypothetical protein
MQGKVSTRGIVLLITLISLAVARSAAAVVVTLTDLNSIAEFMPDTQNGQFNWRVDGVDQLAQQWFWYRIGNNPEQSIDTISAPAIVQSTASTFSSTYTNAALQVKTTYSLFGGNLGSGNSDLSEAIRVKNLTAAPMDFHFFQYVDFDLNGTANDTSVYFLNANAAIQTEGPVTLSETVNTGLGAASTHREVNFWPNTLNELNDGVPTTLNDNLGPIGPGDLTWAFQWDFTIAAGSSVTISKDKILNGVQGVPEPATCGLLLLGCSLLRRRRTRV